MKVRLQKGFNISKSSENYLLLLKKIRNWRLWCVMHLPIA